MFTGGHQIYAGTVRIWGNVLLMIGAANRGDGGPRPLRFGIMCDGGSLARWQAKAIEHLVADSAGTPELLIVDGTRRGGSRGAIGRTWSRLCGRSLLWRAFARMSAPFALETVDLPSSLVRLPRMNCSVTRQGRFSEYFADADVAAIRGFDLDFILRFGFGIIRGDILSAARYGVWSFHHGDELQYRGGPPCFWEIFRGDPVTGAILQRLTGRLDAGVILRKGFLRTANHSYARNVNQLFFETAKWPAFAAAEIANGIVSHVHAAPSATQAPIYRLPSNRQVLAFLPRLATNKIRRLLVRNRQEEWNIGILPLRADELLRGAAIENVRWYPATRGRWTADPMAVAENGSVHVLCEEMSLAHQKAHISATSFDGSSWAPLSKAIDTGTHASYPYLFRFDGDMYCVPETFEANEVRLYRAGDFPRQFECVATLLSGVDAVDSTVFAYDGLFWLLFTRREASGSNLFAYYADHPMGPWKPHLRNPVKIDIRSARPAGPPFQVDGVMYRPAQDSSLTYGGRVVINRLIALSPAEFVEEPCAYVEPERGGPYGEGLHTLCFAGNYCVIDGKRWARRSRRARRE